MITSIGKEGFSKYLPITLEAEERVASADFSPGGVFLAAIVDKRPGLLFGTTRGLYGDEPELEPIEVGLTDVWRSLAFRPWNAEASSGGRKARWQEMAIAAGDRVARYEVVLSGRPLELHSLALPGVHRLAYSHLGSMLAAVNNSGRLLIWDLESREVPRFLGEVKIGAGVSSLAFTRAGDGILLAMLDGRVLRLDGRTSALETLCQGMGSGWECYSIDCHPRREIALLGGSDSVLRVVDLRTGRASLRETLHSGFIRKVEFIHHHRAAVFGASGVSLWDAEPIRCVGELPLPALRPLALRQFCQTRYVAVAA